MQNPFQHRKPVIISLVPTKALISAVNMQMRLPTRASDGPLSNKDAIANLV
jgi:hypothetical protein